MTTQTADTLVFDPEQHAYYSGGKRVPSVTQILGAVFPGHADQAAMERGTYVHRIVELDVQGELDELGMEEWAIPYLGCWRAFLREREVAVAASEMRVFSKAFWYAGTLDLVAVLDSLDEDSRFWVLDIKTGSPQPSHALQTVAYERAIPHITVGGKRGALYLRPDGWTLVQHPHDAPDWNAFVAALTLYNWKETYS